ncbi:MAG TPA: glycosyltransferase family 4 protein [Bryobacteraceae bacterium]|nr:glycosyltransferase family 4 protein [Bryobacteraceae bacterium]
MGAPDQPEMDLHSHLLPCLVLPTPPPSIYYRWYEQSICGNSLVEWAVAELTEVLGQSPWILSRAASETQQLRQRFDQTAVAGIVSETLLIPSLASLLRDRERGAFSGVFLCTPLLPLAPLETVASLLDEHTRARSDFTEGNDPSDSFAPKLLSRELLFCLDVLRLEERGLLPPGGPFPALRRVIESEEFRAFFCEQCGRVPVLQSAGNSGVTGQDCPVVPAPTFPEDIHLLRRAVSRAGGRLPIRGPELLHRWSEALSKRQRAKLRLAGKRLRQVASSRHSVRTRVRTVLYVSVESAYSGAEASLALLASSLCRERYRPVAVVGMEGLLAQRMRSGGVAVAIPGFAFWRASAYNTSYLAELMRKHDVALVHINGWRAHSAALAAKLLGLPVVSHLRVFPEPDSATALAGVDAVMCVSHAVASELRRHPIAAAVFTIHNGVNLNELPERRPREGGSERTVLVVANVGPGKGQELVLRAIPLVQQSVSNVHFLFAGDVLDPGYYARLLELARELDCADRVRFVGFHYPILHLYEQADVFVLPSVREPFSRAVLEAQAVGVPVVAAASGGTPELIEDGVNGLLFTERTPQALAEAVARVLTDPSLAARLAREARRIVCSRFTIEQHVQNVMAVYDMLLEGRIRSHLKEPRRTPDTTF